MIETLSVEELEVLERTYLQLSDEIKKLKLQIGNKDKSELDFFRYLKPRRKDLTPEMRMLIKRKFKAAVKKICKQQASAIPDAIVALQDIMRDRRKKHRELLQLQRKNAIMYLYEKSPFTMGENPMINKGEKDEPMDYDEMAVVPPIQTVFDSKPA